MARDIPVRMFKSDFMEFFTHIHPWQVAVFWGFLDLYVLYRGIAGTMGVPYQPLILIVLFLVGLCLWTLAEYSLHRWLFHFKPKTPLQERLSFMFHGVHHAQPMVKTRLVMPFPLSIPLAALFYGVFALIFVKILQRPEFLLPTFAGFLTGYLFYDLGHYAFHHLKTQNPYLLYVRKHHMRHHGADSHMRFGVSSPIWDYVFGTMPKDGNTESVSKGQ